MKMYLVTIERGIIQEIITAVGYWNIRDSRYYDLLYILRAARDNLTLDGALPISVRLTKEQVVNLHSALEHYFTTREFRNAMLSMPLYMGYATDAMNDVMARLWDSLLVSR